MGEKGHVKPANYLDAHEKFLISVATKGGNMFFFLDVLVEIYVLNLLLWFSC